MSADQPIRVFIGSGEASRLERKTLVHSLRKHTSRELEIIVFNGTHNALEREGCEPVLAGLPLDLKVRNEATEFGLYRFLIPELCDFSGRAIWLDSDMVCLSDIAELWDAPLDGCDFLAKPKAYDDDLGEGWGLSVMLIDCSRCRFDLKRIFADIDQQRFEVKDFTQMTAKFRSLHDYRIGAIPAGWNDFDFANDNTRLIHYTNLRTQPWKFPGHPFGDLWYRYFYEAIEANEITPADIEMTCMRGFCRQDVLRGNSAWASIARQFKDLLVKSISRS